MKTKKEYKYFNIFHYDKEQDYLREQHKNGWKFVRVTGLGVYHFEECEPEDVVYQLDYNREGLEHKAEYVQMFGDCGWEYIQDYAGYSYFKKPASAMDGKEEEIFCDDESRMQMMERVFKGRMVPLLVIFFCVLMPQFFLNVLSFHNYVVGAFLGGILVVYIAVFAWFYAEFQKFKKR